MNESLMRDLHDTQIEELTAVKTAIAELANKPTATPTDIAKVQMMITNIRIPEHDNSPVLREMQKLNNANGEYAESQLGWLKAIYAQNKQQKEQEQENKALINECLDRQQKLCALIDSKLSTVQLYLLAIVLTVILIATFIYTNY
ncbi:MAG: hypothetical protein SNG27_06425 [Rikenellaceae bacterium]